MGLNKSKGNMYKFITDTWNPIAGKCPHNCSYCSTNKFYYPLLVEKYSGKIRLEENELKTNLGKDNIIFVAAQNDLFANDVPGDVILKILEYCHKFDNKYFFQSKNTEKMFAFAEYMPKNSVVCTTIESNRLYPEIQGNSPEYMQRSNYLRLFKAKGFETYVTIEPVMDFDLMSFVQHISFCCPNQVNIGADSGNNNLPEPKADKILALIAELEKFTIVNQKSNLKRLLI